MTGERSRETVRGNKLPLTSKQVSRVALPLQAAYLQCSFTGPAVQVSVCVWSVCSVPQALGEVVELSLVGKDQQEVNKYSVKMEKSALVLKTKVRSWRGLPAEIILRLGSEQ